MFDEIFNTSLPNCNSKDQVYREWQNCSLEFPRHEITKYHLISWCRNLVETHIFRKVSGEWPETLWKFCVSAEYPHQEIRKMKIFYATYIFDIFQIVKIYTEACFNYLLRDILGRVKLFCGINS